MIAIKWTEKRDASPIVKTMEKKQGQRRSQLAGLGELMLQLVEAPGPTTAHPPAKEARQQGSHAHPPAKEARQQGSQKRKRRWMTSRWKVTCGKKRSLKQIPGTKKILLTSELSSAIATKEIPTITWISRDMLTPWGY